MKLSNSSIMKSANIFHVWMTILQALTCFHISSASIQSVQTTDLPRTLPKNVPSNWQLIDRVDSDPIKQNVSLSVSPSTTEDSVTNTPNTTISLVSLINVTSHSKSSLIVASTVISPASEFSNISNHSLETEDKREVIGLPKGYLESQKQPEIVSLKGKPAAFLAMLKVARESGSFEDPFKLSSMIHGDSFSNVLGTDASGFDEGKIKLDSGFIPSFQRSGKSSSTTSPSVQKKYKTFHTTTSPIPLTTPENLRITPAMNETNEIYEEIRSALHIDSSIDDIDDENIFPKKTEKSDQYLPSVNTSRANFLEPKLTRNVSDLPLDKQALGEIDRSFWNESERMTSISNATRTADEARYFSFFDSLKWRFAPENSLKSNVMSDRHDKMVLEAQAERMLEVMNETADPCDDFYEYACGKWSEVYPLEDKALDNTFDRLREGLDEVLKNLLENPILEEESHSNRIAKTLYKGCMNTDKIQELGSNPLKELLKSLGGWPVLEGSSWQEETFDWVKLMATLRTYNNDILLSEWVAADVRNSSLHIVQIDQPELGLPSREYFLNPGDKQYREAYLTLMLDTCRLVNADKKVSFPEMLAVLDFEKELAKILTPAEDRKNLSAVHRRFTVGELQKEVPQIDWNTYLDIVVKEHTNTTDSVIVFGLTYIKKLVPLIEKTDKRTVANYLIWRFVKNRISNLGREASIAKQNFIQVLFGSKSQPDRWLSCVSYVNGNLGYIVGSMFVEKYYPESSKNDSEEMIQLIREAFTDALSDAKWMAEETRQIAIDKVTAMVRNVGYPDFIRDDAQMTEIYSELNFDEYEHFENVIKMLQFHASSTHKLLRKPVNRTEWTTTPAVVNAYYSRSKNMIMFPAGILQPPFYHPTFPRCLNFGGVGVVIGHEISHGFDGRGRQFDSNGNLHQWWTTEDVNNFYDRATCMLVQYGNYEVPEVNMNINSVNTLSENIADNAGIKIAFKAYQKWKKIHGEESLKLPKLDLTHDQLFFLNFGQIWCEVNSPEAMYTKIRGGQHSPNKYRVIGTLSNSDDFSKAFNCKKGSPMNPSEKCVVW